MLEPVKYAEVDSVDGSPGEQELFNIAEAAFMAYLHALSDCEFSARECILVEFIVLSQQTLELR